MKTRTKIFLVSMLLTLGSLGASLLTAGSAYAAPVDEMTLIEKNQSYSLYQAAANCLDYGYGTDSISAEKAADPSTWDMTIFHQSVGYVDGISADQAGRITCGEVFTKGLDLWGYEPGEFLTNIGCPYDGTNYVCSGNLASNFRGMVRNDIYAGSSPTMSDEMLHMAAMAALVANCGATQQGVYNAGDTSAAGNAVDVMLNTDPPKAVIIPQLSADGQTYTDYVYTLPRETSSTSLYVGSESMSCAELASAVRTTSSEFQTYVNETPADTTAMGAFPVTNVDDTACAVDGIGWIVCPALSFISEVTDEAFNFLAKVLESEPSMFTTESETYKAWVIMRDLANVAFIIAFLVIVFSQVTSIGISNYGVKKLLPKIIIAAFLVNVSFLICQLAIEISDILGWSLHTMFADMEMYIQMAPGSTSEGGVSQGLGIAVIVTTLLAGGVGLAFAISIPVILAALFALLMIVLIIVARKAIIVLLVIIAPLAFVAYLLPNTEQWFKKWSKMFTSMLLVFPIISLVFGASGLAAKVIKTTAGADLELQLIAIGVAIIPLFIVPSILKKSMAAIPEVGSKLSGWSSKASGKAGSAGKAQLKSSRLGEIGTNMQARKIQKKAARRSNLGGFQHRLDNSKFGNWTGLNKGSARASMVVDKADAEDKAAAAVQLGNANLTNQEYLELSQGKENVKGFNGKKSKAFRRAAQERLLQIGTHDQIAALHDTISESEDEGERVAFDEAMMKSSKKPKWYTGVASGSMKAGRDISRGVRDSDGNTTGFDAAGKKITLAKHEVLIDDAVNGGKYGTEALATGDKGEIKTVSKRVRGVNGITATAKDKIKENARLAISNELLHSKMSDNEAYVEEIKTM